MNLHFKLKTACKGKQIYTASAKTVIFSNGFNALKMRMQYILLFEAYIITICLAYRTNSARMLI